MLIATPLTLLTVIEFTWPVGAGSVGGGSVGAGSFRRQWADGTISVCAFAATHSDWTQSIGKIMQSTTTERRIILISRQIRTHPRRDAACVGARR
ncbi:MAG TPA: hypothetical protein VGP52_13875 [Stellaceae bacterium]|nr:hypothetical protein [Stellaceae bacterium]